MREERQKRAVVLPRLADENLLDLEPFEEIGQLFRRAERAGPVAHVADDVDPELGRSGEALGELDRLRLSNRR